jgi:wyosine [tRNA(Phe)-imidazoG37] synthetase (radical SAM superfamily)
MVAALHSPYHPAVVKKPINLFTLHSRNWQSNRYVYPVISRRSKGLSIGVNLNPDKVCNFDCVYCCVDRTVPPTIREVDMSVLREELQGMVQWAASGEIWNASPFDQTPPALRRINDIAFSGDGEPTSFGKFQETCEMAAELLKEVGLDDVKLVVITNATLFHQPRVQRALAWLDHHNGEIWAKLDAGTQAYYQLIERTGIPLSRILANIAAAGKLRPIVIQSLFMTIDGVGPSDEEIAAYIDRLHELRDRGTQIKLVQVYTVARNTAMPNILPLPNERLDGITQRVRNLGLAAQTFYGPS